LLIAGYSLRPAMIWIVLLADMLMLGAAWWGLRDTPFATPGSGLIGVFVLLWIITVSMYLHGLWSERVFGMQLESEREARASRADAERAREDAERAREDAELARQDAELARARA